MVRAFVLMSPSLVLTAATVCSSSFFLLFFILTFVIQRIHFQVHLGEATVVIVVIVVIVVTVVTVEIVVTEEV
jgi:hypothetical protein